MKLGREPTTSLGKEREINRLQTRRICEIKWSSRRKTQPLTDTEPWRNKLGRTSSDKRRCTTRRWEVKLTGPRKKKDKTRSSSTFKSNRSKSRQLKLSRWSRHSNTIRNQKYRSCNRTDKLQPKDKCKRSCIVRRTSVLTTKEWFSKWRQRKLSSSRSCKIQS